jgi:hypothetical protein
MIVMERDEPGAVDALFVDVAEALIVDGDESAQFVDVEDALVVEVREVAPLARGSALAQPRPESGEVAPEPESRPDLRVAPEGYRRRRRVRIAATAAAVAISVTLFAVVGFNVVLAQHQIELQSLQRKLQVEETRYYEARNEVAQASSPASIVEKAKALGLVVSPETYLIAHIPPPPTGATETAETLAKTSKATGGSLDHPRP